LRVRPHVDTLTLRDGRADLTASLDLSRLPGGHLVVDIYSFVQVHPDRHLGWWQYDLGGRSGQLRVRLDFAEIGPGSVQTALDGVELAPRATWVNPGYVFEPTNHVQLVVRRANDRVVEIGHVKLQQTDLHTLDRYAQYVYETSAYVPPSAPPTFVLTFHATRLTYIGGLLSEHVPAGSRVLDVASGHSLFTENVFLERLRREWHYKVTCCDLAVSVMEERVKSFPQHDWLISDVVDLPFRADQFDAVLAGEILEHVPSTERALAEWARVLRPGGTLILTTPNRRRLTNRVNRFDYPMAPDHINELSYPECVRALRRAGLRLFASPADYLEACVDWLSAALQRTDRLQTRYTWPRLKPLVELLMKVGNLCPPIAWNLMFVARKPA